MAELTLVPRRTPSGVGLEAFHVHNRHASLGRGAHCDWVLPDPQRLLSKRHCEIVWRNGHWTITDLSSNGTTVGGRTLPPGVPHELHDGDRIGCGSYEMDAVFGPTTEDEPTRIGIRPQDTLVNAPLPQFSNPFEDAGEPGDRRESSYTRKMPPDDAAPFFETTSPRYGRSSSETLSIIHPFDFALGANDSGFDLGAGTPSGDVSSVAPQTTGLHDSFQPPRPASELLPEDWSAPETRQMPPIAPDPKAPPPVGADEPSEHDDGSPKGLFTAPVAPTSTQVSQAETASPGVRPDHGIDPLSVRLDSEIAVEATRPGLPGQADGAAIIAAFMRGAGLEGAPSKTAEAFFEGLGQTFRAFVVGLRRAMIARAEIKGEFRIDQTMIQPFGNNPLKFAVDDDDALAALLGVGRRTGVSSPDAVADALRDIQVHEMALTRAIEPAVREFLAANGPAAVLELLSYPADQPLSLFRRAKAWTTYVRHYQETADVATETLDGAFGRAFGRAYEAARAEIEGAGSSGGRTNKTAFSRLPPEQGR
ncbi:FHA domain-containing protein [Neoasaia chiangmaiensis NBRC 101099]|nr:type VI secretion system-associated FHA domain protein TagH [Neoasaia chiangmaiensis]GBR35620.1 FHA domain-containing protein [Neoasaia chiangmaiensis NBRC 101099]GEN16412.1 phosphopeptide-binding protein [Neoasaia chiangmaiensis]